tara:strand:- start:481 stop:4989 length:4509 start_codon:yes stop_codon:yes gene_type:complete
MSQRTNGTIQKHKANKIIGIQFSILSPEEIRNGSVASINSRDTYINNKPVINGLFDPRMGVQEPGLVNPTDGLDYMQTPGYFGHIDLARPLFYIQYLNTVMKILRCICCKCSKLLISKEKYKHALKMSSDLRWNYVFSIASKIKRCGEDTCDGCGYKQPAKIKKEGLATLNAEWDEINGVDSDKLTMNLSPEIVLKLFRRISDEDITFLGFSPMWSRPDWMICQVLAIPPPAVRPSIKHDSQQRSEDDISHIIVNIIKANNTLKDKIEANANSGVITDWTTVLQYYIATLVDNNIPGCAPVAQRSGRPLKSIKERLNGKQGRVRGNLMGKRVDFSARSVITPDPNVGIEELGVPLKIAKNITYPQPVNDKNIKFLTKLIQNGPDVYPGAKILERKNGDNISLRHTDTASIKLEIGDIVHRHMMNGDYILFNRQPTLHKMSMMGHKVKIMYQGDTFRLNVADTKPYNADFDGDEMNLHMPQSLEAESELNNLAAVTNQIISPANNKSIIGIFQDSLLGIYRFTRENINFTPRQTMNLLMNVNNINLNNLPKNDLFTNFNILSQIIPPMSLKYKTKRFSGKEDFKTSNNVLEIQNGSIIRGQIEKGVLGDGSKGLIQRICNDFSNDDSCSFINNLQNIVTEYMKTSAYSVGISDLIANEETNNAISDAILKKKIEVQALIDETHLGIFENKTGKSDQEEFETKINNILSQALSSAGKIGRESLNKDNRFVIMVNAGSKGSELNISQMITCVGQQNVDGKRIPYGFDNRTLPHFTKYDDSPLARGFVESSFISGLSPSELFFHAMGGRVGLIDTAVKTSQTGYIQRRLIKACEDIKVEYDMTVRNNKNKIIQFSYGDDGFDTIRVEFQQLPIVKMTIDEIYSHFNIPTDSQIINENLFTSKSLQLFKKQITDMNARIRNIIEYIINSRDDVIKYVFKNKDNTQIHIPIAFTHIINNIQGQQHINIHSTSDITPLDAMSLIDDTFNILNKFTYNKPNELFKIIYYYYLNPRELIIVKRFNSKALKILLQEIIKMYKKSIVAPGEMVGMLAAQSIGEPTTQMTLNTFHFAGVAEKSNVTRGVPRIEEILSLSENPKNPSCTIHLLANEEDNQENAKLIMHQLEHTKLRDLVSSVEICFDPDDLNTLISEDVLLIKQYKEFQSLIDECNQDNEAEEDDNKSKWIIRIEMNSEELLNREINMDDVHFAIKNSYSKSINCIFSDYNDDKLIFRLRIDSLSSKKKTIINTLDQSDKIYLLKNFQEQLLDNLVIRGIKNIQKAIPRKIPDSLIYENGTYVKKETWVVDTVGTNLLDLLALDIIDSTRTFTNDIQEIYRVLGIEAARQAIFNEISEVIEFDSTYINYHHLCLLCDRMTCNKNMTSVFRHGINNDNIGPIAKASFEETPEMFLKAARHAELDNMRGVSANVMCGQEGFFGTNAFQVVLDINKITKLSTDDIQQQDVNDIIDDGFSIYNTDTDECSINNLIIPNNIHSISSTEIGDIDNDYDPGF